jgi:hypothetical protein
LQLWNDSKAIAKNYLSGFFPDESKNQLGKIVLGNDQNVADKMNATINDNHDLARALRMGQIPVEGAQNPRKEWAVFKLADLWNNSRQNENLSGSNFLKQFNDPKFAQSESRTLDSSRDLLYSKGTQDDIRRIATAMQQIETGQINPSRYLILRNVGAGIGITGGLATAMYTGSVPAGLATSGAIAGLILGTRGMAKWMVDKNAARLLVAMTEGQALGMPEKFAAQIIGKALKGEAAQLMYANGDRVDGQIGSDGKFTIPLR